MSTVLITGCGLTISPEFRIWGDLWEEGDCFIFNACGNDEGLSEPFPENVQQLVVNYELYDSYFQRRNVFVLSKYYCSLNATAVAYINKGSK